MENQKVVVIIEDGERPPTLEELVAAIRAAQAQDPDQDVLRTTCL